MLTPAKAKFVAAYIAEPNATQAAIKAGYSEKTAYSQGSRLLKDVEIQQELQQANATAVQRVQAAQESAVASAEWIVLESVRLYERCMQDVPVLTSKGEPTGFYQFDSGGANRSLDRLAKRHPEFKDGPVVDNSQHVHLPPGLAVEELRKLASQ